MQMIFPFFAEKCGSCRGGGPLDPLVKGLVEHSSEAELMGMIHKIYLRMVKEPCETSKRAL